MSEPIANTPSSTTPQMRRFGDITRKLVYSIVLIPIVPALAGISINLTHPFTTGSWMDMQRLMHFVFSAMWVVAIIVIWRSVILWTLGRVWLTAITSMIPFVQVIYGQPLWDAGCGSDGFLRFGQHQVTVGVWVWVAVWVWWGWEKGFARRATIEPPIRSIKMSDTAKSIACSIGHIPFVIGCFFIIVEVVDSFIGLGSEPSNITASYEITMAIAVTSWLLIWRRVVNWQRNVMFWTLIAATVCIAIPSLFPFLLMRKLSSPWDDIVCIVPVLGWGIWMAGTVLFWPMRAGAGAAGHADANVTPQCPSCGYLLTGLTKTRCPECGDEPTIDELWRATASVEV